MRRVGEPHRRGAAHNHQFAVEHAAKRVPVIAHVSDAGTAIAAASPNTRKQQAPPRSSPPRLIIGRRRQRWCWSIFVQIGAAVDIPFFVLNAPEDMAGSKINTDLALKLIDRLPNFAGVVDSSLDWQFMIALLTDAARVRSDFKLLSGTELMVSAAAIGASGLFSALAAVAPKLMRRLFDLCRQQKLFEARALQEEIAALRQIVKPGGVAALKTAVRVMGREHGKPRPPLLPLDAAAERKLAAEIEALPSLAAEPRGW